MCACKQKKSFFIEDILRDVKKKPYKNLSNEPTKPLICNKKETPKIEEASVNHKEAKVIKKVYDVNTDIDDINDKVNYFPKEAKFNNTNAEFALTKLSNDKLQKLDIEIKFNGLAEVQNEIEFSKISLEQRRNTYPLYPMPIKPNIPWQHKKEHLYSSVRLEPRQFSYYSDPMLPGGLLRNQLRLNRFVTHPYTIRQAYGLDRAAPNCCSPWWGLGGRRKGGQVRFTAAQTGALERRFNASKYLSPDERRALATTLRLSDRQVKTWFQNRRAKWRRTTPDSADTGSPPTADEGSDEDIHNVDDE